MRYVRPLPCVWLAVYLSLLACQPIKPMTAGTATLPAGTSQVMPCQLTAGERLGNEPLTQETAAARLDLAGATELGERLVITGVVYLVDCVTPLADVLIEVWQADAAGLYGNLAGTLRTDRNGRYELHTVKPGYYAGEANPPPLHIHLRIAHPTVQSIETELLFADDPLLDQANPLHRQLSISLQPTTTSAGIVWHGVFPIVLANKPVAK